MKLDKKLLVYIPEYFCQSFNLSMLKQRSNWWALRCNAVAEASQMRWSVLLTFYPCRQHQSIYNIRLLFYNLYYWKNTEVRTSGTLMVGTALPSRHPSSIFREYPLNANNVLWQHHAETLFSFRAKRKQLGNRICVVQLAQNSKRCLHMRYSLKWMICWIKSLFLFSMHTKKFSVKIQPPIHTYSKMAQ